MISPDFFAQRLASFAAPARPRPGETQEQADARRLTWLRGQADELWTIAFAAGQQRGKRLAEQQARLVSQPVQGPALPPRTPATPLVLPSPPIDLGLDIRPRCGCPRRNAPSGRHHAAGCYLEG